MAFFLLVAAIPDVKHPIIGRQGLSTLPSDPARPIPSCDSGCFLLVTLSFPTGRWAGDRVALIGNYAEENDMPAEVWDGAKPNDFSGYRDIAHLAFDLSRESAPEDFFTGEPSCPKTVLRSSLG